MKGKPKYKIGDNVSFTFNDEKLSGTVFIVDAYGTFEDPTDVSYDIMVEDDNTDNAYNKCLYKHINEKSVTQE